MARAGVKRVVMLSAMLGGFVVAFGCAPATPTVDVCNALVNCGEGTLTQQQSDQILQVCEPGLAVLQLASPDCYACVAENTCGAPDLCLDRCGSLINQVLPGTVP